MYFAVRAAQFVCPLLCVVTVSQGQQGECLCTVCSTVTVLWTNSLPVSGIFLADTILLTVDLYVVPYCTSIINSSCYNNYSLSTVNHVYNYHLLYIVLAKGHAPGAQLGCCFSPL